MTRPSVLPLLAATVLATASGCVTDVPRYDYRPPGLRLEVRGLSGGDFVLRPGSSPVERDLPVDGRVDLSVTAVDPGGVRSVALVGRVTIICENPETGARVTDATDVRHEDVRAEGPGGVRNTAAVGRVVRTSDYRVACADRDARAWVEGTFHGEAEDFHGRWSVTGSLTFWFEVEG